MAIKGSIEEALEKLVPGRGIHERAVRDELAVHLESTVDELRAAGLDDDQALRQAMDKLGDTASIRRWIILRKLKDAGPMRLIILSAGISLLLATLSIATERYRWWGIDAGTSWTIIWIAALLMSFSYGAVAAFGSFQFRRFLLAPICILIPAILTLCVGFGLRAIGWAIPWRPPVMGGPLMLVPILLLLEQWISFIVVQTLSFGTTRLICRIWSLCRRTRQFHSATVLLFLLAIFASGCDHFHAIDTNREQLKGTNLWPIFRNVQTTGIREIQVPWPLFKYQRAGSERLIRIWPLYYRHSGERLLGIARYKEPTNANVGSDIFALQEDSWEGGLSSIALFSQLSDHYSSSNAILHPSLCLMYLENNRKTWPKGRSSQPGGLYSMWIPWWLVDYALVGTNRDSGTDKGFKNHFFPPIIGYDKYSGEFKLLNLYFHRYQVDMLPPMAGIGVGSDSRTYVWPVFARIKSDGKARTDLLWSGFFHQGYWSPSWVWSTREETEAVDQSTARAESRCTVFPGDTIARQRRAAKAP